MPSRLSETSFADEGMGAEDNLIGEMDSLATDHGTKPFQKADKAKRWENEEGEEERFVKHEFESNARLEDVAVSYSLSAAGEFSGHSLASCDGRSSSSSH